MPAALVKLPAHVEVAAGDREGVDGVVEGPVAGAVRAQGGPGAAVPPGDVVGLGDARGVGELPAHVEVAAGDREGVDDAVEGPVAGAVRAQGGPGAAVPPGDVVGLGMPAALMKLPAHVEVAAGDREGLDTQLLRAPSPAPFEPRADQALPFHLAMLSASAMPAALVKAPPT